MRLKKKRGSGMHEGDLTPMIDMTFQLIAFFMVLVNFAESEQNEKVLLPSSELAKPPEKAPDDYLVRQKLGMNSTRMANTSTRPSVIKTVNNSFDAAEK